MFEKYFYKSVSFPFQFLFQCHFASFICKIMELMLQTPNNESVENEKNNSSRKCNCIAKLKINSKNEGINIFSLTKKQSWCKNLHLSKVNAVVRMWNEHSKTSRKHCAMVLNKWFWKILFILARIGIEC